MRRHAKTRAHGSAHRLLATVPAAIVGSIALSLGASPASAVEREVRSQPRPMPLPAQPLVAQPRATVEARQAAATPSDYVVVEGDTVSAIAARFGLSTEKVLAANGLGWSSIIRPGQVLSLGAPAAKAPATKAPAAEVTAPVAAVHTVIAGDTISSIASRHGTSIDAVLSANGLSWSSIIYPGQTIALPGTAVLASSTKPAPAPAPKAAPKAESAPAATHTIVAGDTISSIASRHGVSVDALLSANGLNFSSIIYPGQSIALPGAAAAAAPAPAPASSGLDAEQTANAQLIIRIGREAGVSDRGIAIALATSMVESWMRNLDWGDRDSLGLFQQRPSQGWGSADEVRNAERATRVFYGGAGDPNGSGTRGLLDIPGWEGMGFSDAAQAVQISAYPERYGEWESAAYQWLADLG